MKTYLLISMLFSSIQLIAQNTQTKICEENEMVAEYPTKMSGFYDFIEENMKYPELSKANEIEGRVFVEFFINNRGEVVDESINKGVNNELDEEALRIMKLCPNWIPKRISLYDPNCKLRMILPITFKIPSKN